MFSVKKAVAARNNRQEMAGDEMGRAMPMRGNMADKAGRAMPTMKKGGKVKMSGSSASKRADGIASKGKTKGKMVRMNYGGKC
jgi:hypothetical protein